MTSADQDELGLEMADQAFESLVATAKKRGGGPHQVANALMLAAAHAIAHLCPKFRAQKLHHLTPIAKRLVDVAIAEGELLSGWGCDSPDTHMH